MLRRQPLAVSEQQACRVIACVTAEPERIRAVCQQFGFYGTGCHGDGVWRCDYLATSEVQRLIGSLERRYLRGKIQCVETGSRSSTLEAKHGQGIIQFRRLQQSGIRPCLADEAHLIPSDLRQPGYQPFPRPFPNGGRQLKPESADAR